MNDINFYGYKDLVGLKYTYQFSKILSTKTIGLSTRITKLGGVNNIIIKLYREYHLKYYQKIL